MKFFDKKEEVLDIQLTQFGKQQLSMGKWKPVYYAFFDDNVLYDSEYAGLSEEQNDTEGRIQEDTPQLKTQHVFSGRETDFSKILDIRRKDEDLKEEEKIRIQTDAEKFYSLAAPLGTSDYGINKAPRWSIVALEGQITNTNEQLTGSFRSLNIPQIDLSVVYQFYPRSIYSDEPEDSFGRIGVGDIGNTLFEDGTYLAVRDEQVLLNLEELNVPFENENFTIEVFEYDSEEDPERITPLYFSQGSPQIVNDILISDEAEPQLGPDYANFDTNYVEYYFDVFVDDEIDPNTIDSSIQKLKSRGIYTDSEYDVTKAPFAGITARRIYQDPDSFELVICSDDDSSEPPRAKIRSDKK
jgi:hypothetical protein